MRLQKDERYVIYGTSVATTPNRVARNACSFSFLVAGNETLLSALRSAEAGADSRLVGKVRMKYEEYGVQGEGAASVRVVATGPKTRMEAVTNGNGEFEFLNVLPGKYHFEVSSPNVFEDKWRWPSEDPQVPATGCGYQNIYVWPDGRIAGTVQGSDGKPLDGITVQVFAKNVHGELNSSSLREQKTNDRGEYVLRGLPPGDFIVGVNGDRYYDRSTWRPTFYPGANDRNNAAILHLDRGQMRTGIDLELMPPRTQATLHIEAVLADGTPALDAGANIEDLSRVQRAFALGRDKHTNLLDVTVYVGETYVVRGFQHTSEDVEPTQGNPARRRSVSRSGTTGPIQVNSADVGVRVVLLEDKK